MRIDTDTLLASVDLRAVLAGDLGPATRVGAWRCPFHEDTSPSFGLVKGKPGLWHCFGCGRSGDAIGFLRERHGLSFREACQRLAAGHALPVDSSAPRTRTPQRAPAVRQSTPPPATWTGKAAAVAEEAAAALWTPAGRPGLEYLRGRGVTDETSRVFRLGWIGDGRCEAPAVWGLPADGKPIWTPAGICLPWYIQGECWRLNVRRLDHMDGPKYIGPAGFKPGLFNADALAPGRAAVLVEGEFDALAILQCAGDLAAPVAAGSTCGARVARWLYTLAAAPCVLVAFDADAAGDEAAAWWLDKLPTARRWRPADAKDPAAMHPAVLRAWVAAGLESTTRGRGAEALPFPAGWEARFTCEQLERLAIRTIDARLSDAEALAAEGLWIPDSAVARVPPAG